MASLPQSNVALLVRTDFKADASWELLCEEILVPSDEGFLANLLPVSDPSFSQVSWQEIKAAVPPNRHGSVVVLIADTRTLSSPDHPVLVVDLMDFREPLEPFRSIPSELWSIENNLNIANMDWADFADATDDDGVFRGFD
jgi:hypothetical protein